MNASTVLEGALRSIGLSSYTPRVLSLAFAAMCLILYTFEGGNEMAVALAPAPKRTVLRYARPLGYLLLRFPDIYSTTAPVCVRCLW
jgi:hypothetical protein